MKSNSTKFVILLLLVMTSAHICQADQIISGESQLEWKVKVGEVKTLKFNKVFEVEDYDEDGSQNSVRMEIETESGVRQNITIKAGSTITIEILELNDDEAKVQIAYNGVKMKPYPDSGGYIRKTTDNRTYWEEYVEEYTEEGVDGLTVTLEGDYLIYRSGHSYDSTNYNTTHKVNWKTGWMSYMHQKTYNDTHVITELELGKKGDGGFPDFVPGFELVILVPVLVATSIVLSHKKKKR
ncbi:MAG: hypothetical protein ACFFAJ_09700 [Candidatus Hodarchaeota archaeon]